LQLDKRHPLIVMAGPLQAVRLAAASSGSWRQQATIYSRSVTGQEPSHAHCERASAYVMRPTERLFRLPRKAGPGVGYDSGASMEKIEVGSANTCVFTPRCNLCVRAGCRRHGANIGFRRVFA
jgi:hypothetical protein